MNGPLIVRKDGWKCGTGNRRMDDYISQTDDCDVNRHFRHIHRAINWGGTKVNMNRKRILIKTPTKRYRKFFFSIQLMKRPCNVCAMCDNVFASVQCTMQKIRAANVEWMPLLFSFGFDFHIEYTFWYAVFLALFTIMVRVAEWEKCTLNFLWL